MSKYRIYLEIIPRIAENAPSRNGSVFVRGKDEDVRVLRNRKDSQIITCF
jgi:hypothetical protein